MIILYLLIFVVLCYILIRSGAHLVRSLAQLSKYLKLTEFVLAFILVTFATTLPELVVGITSGIKGLSVVSLGNVIGSNFINLTFILGLVAVVSGGLKVESKIAKKDAWIVFFISLIPLLLLLDKKLSRPEGFVLLIIFGWYAWHLLKSKDAFTHRVHHIKGEINNSHKLLKVVGFFALAVLVLILSAWGVVECAKLIAEELYIPLALVSIVLVAMGTALPELVFGIKSAIVKHEGMCLGNIIGSIVVNSTFILGISAIISPIKLENLNVTFIGAGFMLLAIFLANIFLASGRKVSKKEGWILIGVYVLFLIAEFIFR
ncbi:MAG: sodium:calcium antiporter [Patescibacteria group bacterium]